MMVLCVKISVKPENVEEFIAATKKNHDGSIREPGIRRFDVLRSRKSPAEFFIYEVYDSEDAWKEHKETRHYNEWRETVSDWMAGPREGAPYDIVAPADQSMW